VWYASFSALDPEEKVGPGLNRAPSGYNYQNGTFRFEDVDHEIEEARQTPERHGVQLSEILLKLAYHVLPALPQNMELMKTIGKYGQITFLTGNYLPTVYHPSIHNPMTLNRLLNTDGKFKDFLVTAPTRAQNFKLALSHLSQRAGQE